MMSQFTRKTALSLGLLGSLAMVAAPAAEAQVQVTGGSIEGTAAFFVGGQETSLFDIAIRNLQIVSPNGVLTNPAFVPTATGGYERQANDKVTAGDTGLITGKLSGIGFSATGSLIPFSNVDTALAYNVGRFSLIGNPIAGALISAASLPQIFIPLEGISSDGSVQVDNGEMQIGDLNANITAGFINLPSDIEFRGSSAALAPMPFEMPRKIKFAFEGDDVTNADWSYDGDTLEFSGEANKKFELSTFGNGRRDKFKLEASNGFVDIALGNARITSGQYFESDGSSPVDYKIKGQTNGILALFAPGQVAVSGSGRNTTFEIEQGDNKFKGNTRGNGTVDLFAAAGMTSIDAIAPIYSLSQYQSVTRDTQFAFVQNISESAFQRNSVRFGGMRLVFDGSQFADQSGSFTFKTRGSESLSQAQIFVQNILNNIQFVGTSQSANSIFSGGSTAQFEIVAAPSFNLKVRSSRSGRVKVKFVQQRGRRVFVATRDNVGVAAFEQSGPGSRMFPGLFGVRQLSEEDAASIYELIDTLSVSEAPAEEVDAPDVDDDADDVEVDDLDSDDDDDDLDSDDDDDDDDLDSDDDDDDVEEISEESEAVEPVAEESEAVGPAFTGLDSLSDAEVEAINSTIDSFNGEDATDDAAVVDDAPVAE